MELADRIYRGQPWDPMPGSTVTASEVGLADPYQAEAAAGLYRGHAYGWQIVGPRSAGSYDLSYRGVHTHGDPQSQSLRADKGHLFAGAGIPAQTPQHLARVHHENVMYRLQCRIQAAQERGDQELLEQLELEQHTH